MVYTKHTIESVKKLFEVEGYKLLESKYINPNVRMHYRCPNNHIHTIPLTSWLYHNKRCPYCSEKLLHIDYVRKSFENEGYILLNKIFSDDEKRNSRKRLSYICKNGHKHSTTWSTWRAGHRCPYCKALKMKTSTLGKLNNAWKGGISKLPYCSNWTNSYKEEIKERDGYRCLNPYCYHTTDRLAVHHVDYTKTLCGPDNLITVCIGCNARANTDRNWHVQWYRIILNRRYGYEY